MLLLHGTAVAVRDQGRLRILSRNVSCNNVGHWLSSGRMNTQLGCAKYSRGSIANNKKTEKKTRTGWCEHLESIHGNGHTKIECAPRLYLEADLRCSSVTLHSNTVSNTIKEQSICYCVKYNQTCALKFVGWWDESVSDIVRDYQLLEYWNWDDAKHSYKTHSYKTH